MKGFTDIRAYDTSMDHTQMAANREMFCIRTITYHTPRSLVANLATNRMDTNNFKTFCLKFKIAILKVSLKTGFNCLLRN